MKTREIFLCTIDKEDGELVTFRLVPVDLCALLELADECGDASRAYAGDGHELTSRQFANVARRIRDALGVRDA